MGIFTRLFRGQEGEADEDQSSEEESMDSGRPKPPSVDEPPPSAGDEGRAPPPESESDRRALLSPTPRLAGGLKVASRPRRKKTTNPPINGAPVSRPAQQANRPVRSARAKQQGEATTQVAVPPPAEKPGRKPASRAAPPATPKPAPKGKTLPQPTTARPPVPKGERVSAPVAAKPPAPERRRRSPISEAFDQLLEGSGGGDGVSTDGDRKAVQDVFDDLAAEHVEVVRNTMLELEIEDVGCSWIESSKPPLQSLRTMASEMGLAELCAAIDSFCEAIDAAVTSGQSTVSGGRKAEIQKRYRRLIELIPQAFALDGERDRREPIIVESLLRQVPGVEKITIDKLFAVGLNKLTALIRSNAGDIAATSGIDPALAEQIAGRFRSYRSAVPSAVAAQDSAAERAQLKELVAALKRHHHDYNAAAAGWSDDDRQKKREARRLREEAFLQVRVALARLGETDRLQQIEKRPFAQRIAAVETLLEKEEHGRAHP